jgi:isoleucyl-tRNA synthetase
MSKRLKNYPDPMLVMDQHGADALRLYMINSPVIRGEELKFAETGVKEIVRRVFLKWWNAYSFFDSYAKIDGYEGSESSELPNPSNILDKWIISRAQSLLNIIEKEMEAYKLYNVVPGVLQFIEELTNTYIRLNRSRFWDEGFSDDKREAFDTLYYVLTTLSKVMAPFAPFLADHIYLLLCPNKESVHLEEYPSPNLDLIDEDLEKGVDLMEEIILLGRQIREQEKVKVKIPLKDLHIVHREETHLNTIKPIESYLYSELNVKKIIYNNHESDYVQIICKANGRTLGKRAGKRMKDLMKAVNTLSFDDIQKLDTRETLTLLGDFEITLEDVNIQRTPVSGDRVVSASSKIIASLDTSVDRDQALEGLAREVVSHVQSFRKTSGLNLDDRISLELNTSGDLLEAIQGHLATIAEQTLATESKVVEQVEKSQNTTVQIEGNDLTIGLSKQS